MERYVDFTKIGEGSFGSVHRATDSETGETVALKVFHNAGAEVSRSAVREARFLAECCHCNITALREAYQSSSGRIYLVLEYAQHVLSHQLKSHKKGLPPVAVRSIIFQLLQALNYLHSKGIMHRDCKPANILITNDGMVKLCDFGFARYAQGGAPTDVADDPLTSYVITRWYRPPEVLAVQRYTTAVDIWAVGCIFAEMLTGHPLFPGSSAMDQMYIEHVGLGGLSEQQKMAMRAHPAYASAKAEHAARLSNAQPHTETVFDRLAPFMSRSMMQFFKACLIPDPEQRATAWDLLDMPFIREGAWEAPAPTAGPTLALDEQDASEAAPPPQYQHMQLTPHPPPSNSHTPRKSNNKKMGPTVKQRRADVVAQMMDSEEEDEEVLLHLQSLPSGVPLSDPESEDDGPVHSAAVTPMRPVAGSTQQSQQQVQVQPVPPPKQPNAPMSAGFLQSAQLHTTFAPGTQAAVAAAMAAEVEGMAANALLSAISADALSAGESGPRTSAPSRLSAARAAVGALGTLSETPGPSEPQRPSAFAVQGHSPGYKAAPPARGDHLQPRPSLVRDGQADGATQDSEQLVPGAPSLARKLIQSQVGEAGSAHGNRGRTGPESQPLPVGKSLAFATHHQELGNDGLVSHVSHVAASNNGADEDNGDKPVSSVRKALKRVNIQQSASAMLLPSSTSMRLAKPMAGLGTQQGSSTGNGKVSATSGTAVAHQGGERTSLDSGHGSANVGHRGTGQSRLSAKPTAVQMTAAAITQASTSFAGPQSPWADSGPKSLGRRAHDPECPPPPGAGAVHHHHQLPQPTNMPQKDQEPADADDSEENTHKASDPAGQAAAHGTAAMRRLQASSPGTLHVSGRLNRVVPGTAGGLVQAESALLLAGDHHNRGRLVSNSGGIMTRMSVPAPPTTNAADGQAGSLAGSLKQRENNKSVRVLSPMGLRLTTSKRLTGASSLLASRQSESGGDRQQALTPQPPTQTAT